MVEVDLSKLEPKLYLVFDRGLFEKICDEVDVAAFGNITKRKNCKAKEEIRLVRSLSDLEREKGIEYLIITQPSIFEDTIRNKISEGKNVAIDVITEIFKYMRYVSSRSQSTTNNVDPWDWIYNMLSSFNETAYKSKSRIFVYVPAFTPSEEVLAYLESYEHVGRLPQGLAEKLGLESEAY